MENGNAVSIIRDSTARTSVVQAKLDQAITVASQDFPRDWKASVGVPIGHISERFSHLETGTREVVVTPCVGRQAVDNLHVFTVERWGQRSFFCRYLNCKNAV